MVKRLVITCRWQMWLMLPGGAMLKGLEHFMPKPHRAAKLPETWREHIQLSGHPQCSTRKAKQPPKS